MKAVLIVGSGFVTLFVFAGLLKLAGPIVDRGDWLALVTVFGLLAAGLGALCWLPAFLVERLRPRP